ncbi:MAG TPA: DinB family protein [Fimbriimonadaceae bacterium]|nr:DinB family protein [Fimbriimonadaceae bacterium]
MSDFDASYQISRKRFEDAVLGLSQAQLNWRLHPGVLTIGEMALHVAGVEVSFISQLKGLELDTMQSRLKQSATEGVVNENPFPFSELEITPEAVAEALQIGRAHVESVIGNPSNELRSRTIKSALGPMIDGTGALARLAFHPGYHQGQAHLIATAPGFPRE